MPGDLAQLAMQTRHLCALPFELRKTVVITGFRAKLRELLLEPVRRYFWRQTDAHAVCPDGDAMVFDDIIEGLLCKHDDAPFMRFRIYVFSGKAMPVFFSGLGHPGNVHLENNIWHLDVIGVELLTQSGDFRLSAFEFGEAGVDVHLSSDSA